MTPLNSLTALPAFSDNYIWLFQKGNEAVVVDPGDADVVEAALQERALSLRAILVTHHHADHTGGVVALQQRHQPAVFVPAGEAMPFDGQPVTQGDTIALLGWTWQVLDVPGHTAGHVAYVCPVSATAPLLFCGDTLFSAGCGRLFEGTPAQMLHTLDTLAALPDDTQVCCAHEYTLSNLKFALAVEPENADLQAYARHCQDRRQQGQPTLPSRLAMERRINPFLRVRCPAVQQAVRQHSGTATTQDEQVVAVFAALREWKNNFS